MSSIRENSLYSRIEPLILLRIGIKLLPRAFEPLKISILHKSQFSYERDELLATSSLRLIRGTCTGRGWLLSMLDLLYIFEYKYDQLIQLRMLRCRLPTQRRNLLNISGRSRRRRDRSCWSTQSVAAPFKEESSRSTAPFSSQYQFSRAIAAFEEQAIRRIKEGEV